MARWMLGIIKVARRGYSQFSRTPAPAPPELRRLLNEYSERSPRPVPLSTLLAFGSPPSESSLLASAEYTLSELPRRLYHRVRAFESLPYIVGTNPFISKILHGYRTSFQALAAYPSVQTLEDNRLFIDELALIVQSHSNDIATMAKGFQECTRYMLPADISSFLDTTITARIALRLIAEQHIAISRAFMDPRHRQQHAGVIDAKCSPFDMIRFSAAYVSDLCEATLGASPAIVYDGKIDATFSYVPVHLEYILTEILKNSFRASVEHHHAKHGSSSKIPIPSISITIAPPTQVLNQDGPSFLSLRVRDEGGGIAPTNMERIFSYAFTTAGRTGASETLGHDKSGGAYAAQYISSGTAIDKAYGGGPGEGNLFGEITGMGLQTGLGTIAGLGYGLPMAKLYANYFAGSLQLVTLYGHGTDCFIKLRCLDDRCDVEI